MIENEQHLRKESLKTGVIGSLVSIIITIVFQNASIMGGYILGVVFSQFVLFIDCQMVDGILKIGLGKPYVFSTTFYLLKLGIYAIGFLIAVKVPMVFNIFSVFVGYLTTKLTIYRLELTRR